MGTTEKVAKFAVDFDFNKLQANGVEQIKFSILDTLGVALAATKVPIGPIMNDFVKEMGGAPHARVIGSGVKTSVSNAAVANGTLAHAEDYDTMPHCGVVLVPTALILGEQLKLGGKKIIEAYAVGFEIGQRMHALGAVAEAGFHFTSLFFTMGGAVESAKLLGLDVAKTRAALGIAASMASGIMQNFGTHTKALHGGHATRCGILAASLAKKGFTGDPDVLEAPRGFFYVLRREQADIKRVAENLGNPLAIEKGLFFKAWPNCGDNHGPLTAIFHLIEKYDIKPEQVAAVEVMKSSKPPAALIRTNPREGFEGKFSLEYNMATAIVDRKVDVSSYTDEKLARPMIQELMKKVKAYQDPAIADLPQRLRGENPFNITLTLKLKDGRVFSQKRVEEKELKGEEIYEKYRENARFAGVAANKIERAIELVKGLENVKDVTELMETVS